MAALSRGSCGDDDDLNFDAIGEDEDRHSSERVRVLLEQSTEHLLEDGTLLVSAGMDGMIAEEQEIGQDDVEYNEEVEVTSEDMSMGSSSQPAILLAASALGISISTAEDAANDRLSKCSSGVNVCGGKNNGIGIDGGGVGVGGASTKTTIQLLVCDAGGDLMKGAPLLGEATQQHRQQQQQQLCLVGGGGGGSEGEESEGEEASGVSNRTELSKRSVVHCFGNETSQSDLKEDDPHHRHHGPESPQNCDSPSAAISATAAAATAATASPLRNDPDLDVFKVAGNNGNAMIDASDFRMGSDPIYTTLTSTAHHNGRSTPTHILSTGSHHPVCSVGNYSTSYATLQPLQPLPPISTISSMQDKFQAYSPGGNGANGGQNGNSITGSFVMQNNGLSNLSLGSPYNSYDKLCMSPPHYGSHHNPMVHHHQHQQTHHMSQAHSPIALSPPHPSENVYSQNNGLHYKQEPHSPGFYSSSGQRPSPPHHELSPHSSTHGLDHSPSGGSMIVPTTSSYGGPLTSGNNPSLNGGMTSVSPHAISPVPHASPGSRLTHHLDLSPPSPTGHPHHPHHGGASILAAAAAAASMQSSSPIQLHHPHHLAHQVGLGGSQVQVQQPQQNLKSSSGSNNNNSGSGETEEINTKDLAQRISAELKRYSIPQAIFAQRVLCRSQGTLSDLLRNPKPWSKLKSGRETFRRMAKWLQEPEFQRMSALRLAGQNFYSIIFIFIFISNSNLDFSLSPGNCAAFINFLAMNPLCETSQRNKMT